VKTIIPSPNIRLETYLPRLFAISLLAMLLLALTGCQHPTTTTATTGPDPAGVYTLVSVNGQNVPCNLTHESAAMTVKSGSFTITTNGTCRSLCIFAVPPHPDIHREVTATYTQQGAELIMRWHGAGTTKGQINGDEFTMNNEGMIFFYRK